MYEIIKNKVKNIPLDEIISMRNKTSNKNLQDIANILKAIKLENCYPEMEEPILVIDKTVLEIILSGIDDSSLSDKKIQVDKFIKSIADNSTILKRSEAEYNKNYIQLTINTVIRNVDTEKFFIMKRTINSTDNRVIGSMGIPGSHIYIDSSIMESKNMSELFMNNYTKRIHQEVSGLPEFDIKSFERFIYIPDSNRQVDSEHFGLVFYIPVKNDIALNDTMKNVGSWLALHEIAELIEINKNNIDSWTRAIMHYYFRKPNKGLGKVI